MGNFSNYCERTYWEPWSREGLALEIQSGHNVFCRMNFEGNLILVGNLEGCGPSTFLLY